MSNSTTTRGVFARLALILTMALCLAFTRVPISPVDVAAQVAAGGPCADHTLRGDYGLLASGILKLPPFPGGPSEHFVATAMWTFHGDGTFTQQGPGAALHGEITGTAPPRGDVLGTYNVDANCTGTMALHLPELPVPIQYAMVIVDNAREIRGIVTSPTSTTSVTLTRK